MKAVAFILSFCWIIGLPAQALAPMMDTALAADQMAIDPMGFIYLYHKASHQVCKYNQQLELQQCLGLNKSRSGVRIDATDPLKPVLYYPGEFLIQSLDFQWNVLSIREEPMLNDQATLCNLDSDQMLLFDGYNLSVLQLASGKTMYPKWSNPMAIRSGGSNGLKKVEDHVFLFIGSWGIRRFTLELFETNQWMIPGMTHADCTKNTCFYSLGETLYRFDLTTGIETKLYTAENPISSLAVTDQLLGVLVAGNLKLFRLP